MVSGQIKTDICRWQVKSHGGIVLNKLILGPGEQMHCTRWGDFQDHPLYRRIFHLSLTREGDCKLTELWWGNGSSTPLHTLNMPYREIQDTIVKTLQTSIHSLIISHLLSIGSHSQQLKTPWSRTTVYDWQMRPIKYVLQSNHTATTLSGCDKHRRAGSGCGCGCGR